MMSDGTGDLIAEPRPRVGAWLARPMLENRSTYVRVAVAAALVNVFGLAASLFSMIVYDRVVPNDARESLTALTVGLGVVVAFDFALRTLRGYFADVAGADIDARVGEEVFDRILKARLELRRGSTGALAGLMRELEALRDFFASATLTAVVDVPFVLLTVAVIAMIGGPVALVLCVTVPVVILAGWLANPALERLSAQSLRDGLNKQSVLVEAIGGLETVKAVGAGPMLARRWSRAVRSQSDNALRQRLVSSLAVTVAGSAGTVSYAGVIVVGVHLIAARELTSGGLVACSLLAGRAMAPLGQIAQLLSRLSSTRTAYRQIDEVMRRPVEGPAGEAIRPSRVEGRVEFRNVGFTYPGGAEPVLREVSFRVEAGERVALLGRVGSGKSTIARLAMGLYPAGEGVVMVDGTDVRQLDPAALRAGFGAAVQGDLLLTGSVRENVCLDRDGVDDEEMLRAAHVSGAHQFLGSVANGYDLRLADRGEGLSGGQRQSIALARALAGRPPVLVFDEPTSAMDAQTESQLVDRLEAEVEGRTLLVVSHRPALLRLVSRVILVENGRVTADGPRDEVMRRLSRPVGFRPFGASANSPANAPANPSVAAS